MRIWAVLLVLLLLAVPGAPQSPGDADDAPPRPEAVYAPVQTVVDAYPAVVRLAIDEALFDGTPDDAEALVARMDAYAAAFLVDRTWPEEALASQVAAQEAYAYVLDATAVAAGLVPDTAVVAVTTTACDAWQGNATYQQAAQWRAMHGSAARSLAAATTAIEALAARAPIGVDTGPYETALGLLGAFQEGTVQAGAGCLEELVDRLPPTPVDIAVAGVAGDGALWFRIDPATTWPGGRVKLDGTTALGGPVRVVSAVTEPIDLPVADGAFQGTMQVRTTALPGRHDVSASVGDLEATRPLTIVRAPLELEAEGPAQVALGDTVGFVVHARGPGAALLPEGTVLAASGDLERAVPLEEEIAWVPERTGLHRVVFAYAGDARVAPAATEARFLVVANGTAGGGDGTGTEGTGGTSGAGGTNGAGGLRGVLETLTTGDPPPILFLVLFVVLPLLAAALHAVWRRRRPHPAKGPRWPVPEVAFRERERAPQGFVGAVAAFVLWLIGRGTLRPSATARDAARHLEERGYRATGLALRFEAIRYGPEEEGHEERRKGPAWLRWVRRRES